MLKNGKKSLKREEEKRREKYEGHKESLPIYRPLSLTLGQIYSDHIMNLL